jgi:hypothetical protein
MRTLTTVTRGRALFLSVFFVLVFAAGLSQGVSDDPSGKEVGKFKESSGKPDLTIIGIKVNRGCRLIIRVRNNGPGRLSKSVYYNNCMGVSVYVDGRRWGGRTFSNFDPKRKLLNPGGEVTYESEYKVNFPVVVKAYVDPRKNVKETNEYNNTFTRQMSKCR